MGMLDVTDNVASDEPNHTTVATYVISTKTSHTPDVAGDIVNDPYSHTTNVARDVVNDSQNHTTIQCGIPMKVLTKNMQRETNC